MQVKDTFLCTINSDGEECQGIITDRNIIYIGVDVWRMLRREDTCSYPVRKYFCMDEVLENVVIKPKKKAYYMPERNSYGNIS